MSDDIAGHTTPYGFQFGPLSVTRLFSHEGRVAVRLQTVGGKTLAVYCSPKGQSLRVFDGEGNEWAPTGDGNT